MKKSIVLFILSVFTLGAAISTVNAQTVDMKQVQKEAKKEAKRLTKEGWQVSPGDLSLQRQLESMYAKKFERDKAGYEMFIIGRSQPVAQTMDAARIQAGTLSRLDIAEQISSQITGLVEASVGNKQISESEAVSVTQVIGKAKELISAKLGRTIPLVRCYRKLPNGNVEYLEQVGYPSTAALEKAKEVIREQLEKELSELSKKIDKVFEDNK